MVRRGLSEYEKIEYGCQAIARRVVSFVSAKEYCRWLLSHGLKSYFSWKYNDVLRMAIWVWLEELYLLYLQMDFKA